MALGPPSRLFVEPPSSGTNNTPLGWTKTSSTNNIGIMKGSQYNFTQGTPTNQAYGEAVTQAGKWECVIVLNSSVAPYNKTGANVTPLFWVCPDIRNQGLEQFCALLPGQSPFDPAVSRGTLLRGMIKNFGYYFMMRDGRSPIDKEPILSYDFTDKRCWDPDVDPNQVFDLSGNNLDGEVLPSAADPGLYAWTGVDSTGGSGINMQDQDTWINVPGNLRSTVKNYLTYDVLAQRNNTSGAQYLWDARNCSGTWMLTEYSGYDFNNGNALRMNTSPANGYNLKFHYLQTSGEQGEQWFNAVSGGGNVGSTPSGPSGNNFRIGTRYTNSSRWNGWMSGFWIYDGELTQDEADVINYHRYYFWRGGH